MWWDFGYICYNYKAQPTDVRYYREDKNWDRNDVWNNLTYNIGNDDRIDNNYYSNYNNGYSIDRYVHYRNI